jgi:hypothetical protein
MRNLGPIYLAVLLFLAVGTAHAQLLVEDFDAHTTGSPPAWRWWNNGSSGTILVDDTTYRGTSGKSVELVRTTFDGNNFGFGRNFPPIEGPAELTFYFRVGATTDEILTAVGGNNADGQVAWWVGVGGAAGNAIGTHTTAGGWNHVMDVAADTWYEVTLEIDPSTFTYDITVLEDGDPGTTATETGIPFRDGSAVKVVDQFQFGNFSDAVAGPAASAFVDDVEFIGTRVLKDDFESGNVGSWSSSTRPLTAVTSCYQTVTTDAYLANDLNCDSLGLEDVPVELGASNIFFDLNGHTIKHTIPDQAVGIGVRAMNVDGVTVQNGVIQDFLVGMDIVYSDLATVRDLKLSNLVEDDPEKFLPGLRITESRNVLVRDTFIEFLPVVHKEAIVTPDSVLTVDNVEVWDASVGVNISGNEHISNGTVATVINSRFVRMNIAGILIQITEDSRIADNEFDDNEIGVSCDAMWQRRITGLTIEDNSFHDGSDGIQFLAVEDSSILNNLLHHNGGGIILESNMECLDDIVRPECFYSTGNIISGNVALDNFLDLRHDVYATGNTWIDNICQTKEGAEISPCTGP